MVEAAPVTTGLASRIDAIETAFVTHWSHFGRWPEGSLRDEDGVLWFETPIAHMPYNMVLRTAIREDADADRIIDDVIERFRARNVPLLWVRRPSDRPDDLGRRLAARGLDLVEQATGMDLDLGPWEPERPPDGVEIVDAQSDAALSDYETLIRTYWSVPEAAREQIERFNRYWSGERSPGVRLVAYIDGTAVGKLFLNTAELPKVAIYGVAVTPAARGRGVATGLMSEALRRAKATGATLAVLHSSAMALSLYRRMGFQTVCTLEAYGDAPLFGTHHH